MPENSLPNQNLNQQGPALQNQKNNFKTRNKKFHLLYLLIVILILFLGFFLGNIYQNTFGGLPFLTIIKHINSGPCTLEAKICPDGMTSVGRKGPNCEFEACPKTKPADTSNWKTYEGDDFSFKYPTNGEIEEFEPDAPAPRVILKIPNSSADLLIHIYEVGSLNFSNVDDAVNYELKSEKENKDYPSKLIRSNYSNREIIGEKLVTEENPNTEWNHIHVYTLNKNQIYHFEFRHDDNEDRKKMLLLVDQIISTFKFTKTDQQEEKGIISDSDKSGWKKYTNPTYNFSFEYPNDGKFTQEGKFVNYEKWGPSQKEGTEYYDAINLNVYADILNGKTIDDLVDAEVQRVENGDISTISQNPKNIIINGVKGIELEIEGLGKFKYFYLQPKDEYYIKIRYSNPDPTKQGFQNTVDQILSSFKFN